MTYEWTPRDNMHLANFCFREADSPNFLNQCGNNDQALLILSSIHISSLRLETTCTYQGQPPWIRCCYYNQHCSEECCCSFCLLRNYLPGLPQKHLDCIGQKPPPSIHSLRRTEAALHKLNPAQSSQKRGLDTWVAWQLLGFHYRFVQDLSCCFQNANETQWQNHSKEQGSGCF